MEAELFTKQLRLKDKVDALSYHTPGWTWVQKVCWHLWRQACLNNRKRAQLKAGCASDAVIALTFLQRHFYVALQSARYKEVRSWEERGGHFKCSPLYKKCRVIIMKIFKKWGVALFNSACTLQFFLSSDPPLSLCPRGRWSSGEKGGVWGAGGAWQEPCGHAQPFILH